MWRGGFRLGLSVTGPFGCRCLSSLAMLRFHIPLIKPGVRFSRTRLSDKGFTDMPSSTPVARWALIARGTAYSNRFPVPSGGGLPHIPARSATTLEFSRPAQRSLAIIRLRRIGSPSRQSDPSVSTAAPIRLRRTGWSDPVAEWELHPLKTNT